jgi:tRNA threonylcarbamoyladenosine biosynthesis protein TsaE
LRKRAGLPLQFMRKQILPALASEIYKAWEMIVIELPDEAATAALAARIAALARPGDVIALKGELGAGKTSFARAFIRARGGVEAVPSPTFTLVQVYELGEGTIWHIDLYRLRHPEEAWELDIEDAFHDGVSLIEWPERLGPLIPARRLEITLSEGATPAARLAAIDPPAEWATRLAGSALPKLRHPRESAGPGEAAELGPLDSRFRGNDQE